MEFLAGRESMTNAFSLLQPASAIVPTSPGRDEIKPEFINEPNSNYDLPTRRMAIAPLEKKYW